MWNALQGQIRDTKTIKKVHINIYHISHRFRITALCDSSDLFLDERLTGQSYINFLNNKLNELLEEVPLIVCMWFMHDGAPHIRVARQYLNKRFAN